MKEEKGFSYFVSMKKIREFQKIPIEKRLAWLYEGNKLRKYYPQKTIEIQEKFRRGA